MAIITHNLTAMNTNRQLGIKTEDKKKSVEKLSSGYRINRSADDAAGLQISEKMRYQIRGMNKGSRNIQDGVSMIQTADGALEEVQSILQRMNELSTQAANDTNTENDREALHKELLQLKSEINRISRDTTFNTYTVLRAKQLVEIEAEDYSSVIMDDAFYGIANRTGNDYVSGKSLDFKNVNENNKEQLIGKQFYVTCSQNCGQTFSFVFTDQTTSSASNPNGPKDDLTIQIGVKDTQLKNGEDIVKKIYDLVLSKQGSLNPGGSSDVHIGHANGVSLNGSSLIFYSVSDHPPYNPKMGTIYATDMINMEQDYHIQVNDRPYQEIMLKLRTINSATLGLGAMDVNSFEAAGNTMEEVRGAIENLSDYRSYLGAMQNRLEKAMLVVDNTAENTQYSESKLRDTNMPEEMVQYSKNKILEQFGEVMLAQTNQMTDSVAYLLA